MKQRSMMEGRLAASNAAIRALNAGKFDRFYRAIEVFRYYSNGLPPVWYDPARMTRDAVEMNRANARGNAVYTRKPASDSSGKG